MAIFKLIENTNPALTIPLSGCSEDMNRQEMKDNLIEPMEHYNGIGLSANQCGVMERVFVMYSDVKKREIIACFNPKIVTESDEEIFMEEGCLTYPGLFVKIFRPDRIVAQWEDENRELHKETFTELQSRVFQHEYDHMEGIDFRSLAGRVSLDMAQRKVKRATRKMKKMAENE